MSGSEKSRGQVVVVGGGIAGLAAANRLVEMSRGLAPEAQPEVLLLEASDRAGGAIRTVRHDDCILECGPDSFITQKPWAVDLCRRLGLEDCLIRTNESCRRTFVAHRGKLHPLPEGFLMLAPTRWWPFITSPLFSPLGKLRMALDIVLPAKQGGDDESLADFVVRRLGREALDRIAQPMIGGIYTADPGKLSLRATMPRFLELEKNYGGVIRGMLAEQRRRVDGTAIESNSGAGHTGAPSDSGARYSLFVTLEKGMQQLVDRLIEVLPPDCLRLRCPVSQVVRGTNGRRWIVQLSGGETVDADAVIFAAPSLVTSRMVSQIDPHLSADLSSIGLASSAVVNLIFKRADIPDPPDGFGFVVPAVERLSLIACTFSSIKFRNRSPEDKVVVRAFLGGALNEDILALSDDHLLRAVQADLRTLLSVSAQPEYSAITRWPKSMPQYHVGHLDLVARIESRLQCLPGIALAGNAYRGVGIPDCIHSGETAAEQISRRLKAGMER